MSHYNTHDPFILTIHDGMVLIVIGHMIYIFVKTGLKNPENCKFVEFVNFHCSVCYLVRAIFLPGMKTTPTQLPGSMAKGVSKEKKGKHSCRESQTSNQVEELYQSWPDSMHSEGARAI